MFDIYIPTKGRAKTIKTITHFKPGEVILVVEPQDYDEYKIQFSDHKINILDKNDQGLAYARQSILEDSKRPFWMLDDDIVAFYRSVDGKNIQLNNAYNVLQELGKGFSDIGVGQGALEYSQFSWSATSDVALNSYCDVCVWIDPVVRDVCSYIPGLVPKEDRDFTLQVIMSGFGTARSRRYSFKCPKNGSNKGGLYDVYKQSSAEIIAVRKMCNKYPGIITPQRKPDGRIDCKINWSKFKA